ncbi:acyltransferase [Microbispora hainanensis]|uniref:acyltransferase family protein n=1 Tax=Microbispora TaxID=2005 RepID=UPI001157CBF6|nr:MULTISPECIES: acyltransferase [Microbispora]NJP26389.1 acyltransferase [Microbispora sp. CL1-1]TQS12477.1 acyltransferase [Microbispora sp. SCL1-1]
MFVDAVERNRTRLREEASPARSQPSSSAPRQGWLDALRGVAALVVVFEHCLDGLFPEVRAGASQWFNFGQYGVLVFFLVSGYVVPVSLERRGSVGGFWITRVFRLYPLWLVAAAAGTVFGAVGVYATLPDQLADNPGISALAHLTMLQDLLQVVSVVNVFWTLSYEMVFYLLVTALFVLGAHHAGAPRAGGRRAGMHRVGAIGMLAFAAAAVTVGGLLPAGALSRGAGTAQVVVITAVVLLVATASLAFRGRLRVCGTAAAAVLALVLLGANSRVGAWESLAILATMFAGTVLYRLDQGQLRWKRSGWALACVPVASIAAAWAFGPGWGMPDDEALAFTWGWSTAVAAAWATFFAARFLRRRRMPRALVGLGLISYSVYLLHPLAVQVLRRLTTDPARFSLTERLVMGVLLLGVVLACSALTYRAVERPAQSLGRHLARSVRSRTLPADARTAETRTAGPAGVRPPGRPPGPGARACPRPAGPPGAAR